GPRLTSSSTQEYCNSKRKGSPLIENCQPRKIISLAEAVCTPDQFETSTPDHFPSRPKIDQQRSRLQHRKGIPVKHLTIPHPPNLRAHLRSRPVHYLTREEEEQKEAEEMKAEVRNCVRVQQVVGSFSLVHYHVQHCAGWDISFPKIGKFSDIYL
ncbi:hypothetical protein Cfor_00307, partial [Coptotermes formosanus]